MKIRSYQIVVRALLNSSLRPVGLGIAALASVAAIFLGSGAMAGAGAAAYVAAILGCLARPGLWGEAADHLRRAPPALPFPDDFSSPEARDLLTRLRSARIDRHGALPLLRSGTRVDVAGLAGGLTELEESAVGLLWMLEWLSRGLATPAGRKISRSRVVRLRELALASRPEARIAYDQAREEVERTLESREETEAWKELLLARLEAILCALETLPARVVALELRQATAQALAQLPPAGHLGENLRLMERATAPALLEMVAGGGR